MLTDGLWKQRYGADPAILGKSITLEGRPYVVVGVLPPKFTVPRSKTAGRFTGTDKEIEAFVPFGWDSDILHEVEGDHNYFAIGRLKPGVTAGKAEAELDVFQHAISQETPDKIKYSATVIPLQEYLVGASRRSLLLLLAAVGAVFLIACINIANLLPTRALSKKREMAIQIALGSTRAQMFTGALTEPLILCAVGLVLGIALAMAIMPLLLRNMPIERRGSAKCMSIWQ